MPESESIVLADTFAFFTHFDWTNNKKVIVVFVQGPLETPRAGGPQGPHGGHQHPHGGHLQVQEALL